MPTERDHRDVLKVLQQEERFLKSGGYDRPPAVRGEGPTLIFQDSPSCPNYGTGTHSIPCQECALTVLVSANGLKEKIPCRHIRLNNAGETVEMLYRWRTLAETKKILADWLALTIVKLANKGYLRHRKIPKTGPPYHVPDST
jgi:hypothetical protein